VAVSPDRGVSAARVAARACGQRRGISRLVSALRAIGSSRLCEIASTHGAYSVPASACNTRVTRDTAASLQIESSLIEDSHEAGLMAIGAEFVVERTTISRTEQNQLGEFGDGIAVTSHPLWHCAAVIHDCHVDASLRAGVASFGASVELRGSTLECNGVQLDGEQATAEAFDFCGSRGQPLRLRGRGRGVPRAELPPRATLPGGLSDGAAVCRRTASSRPQPPRPTTSREVANVVFVESTTAPIGKRAQHRESEELGTVDIVIGYSTSTAIGHLIHCR